MLEQLRYDMITGLFHHKKRALLVIISVLLTYVFMCFSYRGLINTADFIKLLFSGMSYITDEKRFVIPNGIWLAINLVLAFHIGMIVNDDLGSYGKLRLMKVGSRIKWWIAKVVLVSASVVAYYMLILAAACSTAIISLICRTVVVNVSIIQNITVPECMKAIAMLVSVSIMISIVQAVITLIDYKIGIVCVGLFMAYTMYDRTHAFIGNYLMLMRYYQGINNYIVNVSIVYGVIIMASIVGIIIVKKCAIYIWR